MKHSWTKDLNAQQRMDVSSSFKASTLLRRRLVEMLEEKERASIISGRSKTAYDSPNWAYERADQCGYERALKEIIDLI